MSRSISVRSRLTSVPSFSNGSISCNDAAHVVNRGLAQLFQLLVDDHGADAVVHIHLQQQRAVECKRNDVAALHAAFAGLHAVLQVKARVGRCCAGGSFASKAWAAASGSSVSMGLSSLSGSVGCMRMPGLP